jgi:hypothetical protein
LPETSWSFPLRLISTDRLPLGPGAKPYDWCTAHGSGLTRRA